MTFGSAGRSNSAEIDLREYLAASLRMNSSQLESIIRGARIDREILADLIEASETIDRIINNG